MYVYKNGKVSFNQVEIGRHLGDAYELLSGDVADGDMVAVTGLARLKDGLEVNVEK